MYQRVRLRSSHAGLQWHVPCCMHTILVYHCNKQASNVFLSIQFDTNVSQLLRHVLPCLMILFHLSVNCLGVVWIDCLYVCRVCFDCATHQWCTVGIYCASASSEWPFFKKKWKKIFFSKKNGLTSGLTRGWRQASDVSPTPPDGLTSGGTTKCLRPYATGVWGLKLLVFAVFSY